MAEKPKWSKLEPAELIVIGPKVPKFAGLLTGIIPDEKYPGKVRYQMVAANGRDYEIAGNAALHMRIKQQNVGQLLMIEYQGVASGREGKYKQIEVYNIEREDMTPELIERFPRWKEFERTSAPESDPDVGFDGFGI